MCCAVLLYGATVNGSYVLLSAVLRRGWSLDAFSALCGCLVGAGGAERLEADARPLRQLCGAVCSQDLLEVRFSRQLSVAVLLGLC